MQETELKNCPFCGGKIHHHQGYQEISYFLCGLEGPENGACGAIISFRPNLRGEAAIQKYQTRNQEKPRMH